MAEIVCLFSDTFEIRDDNGQFVERDDEQLRPGNYYIAANGRSLLSLSPSLRTSDRWNMSQFEMLRNLFLVKEEYSLNAINIVLIKEKDLPDPVIFLTRSLVRSTPWSMGYFHH